MSILEKAYAKINLHLEVLNKRDDGFHNIFGLFSNIDYYDLLKLEKIEVAKIKDNFDLQLKLTGGRFSEAIADLPLEDNLIIKAARLFLKKHRLSGTIHFSLEKNIPPGGGLGGGSSDAAAALRLLNRVIPGLTEYELENTASELGSDIPYCLRGGIAICEGRGEIVEIIPGKLNYHVVAANCGIHINTAWAYNQLARTGKSLNYLNKYEEKKNLVKQAVSQGDLGIIKEFLTNDFQEKVFEFYREVDIIYGYFKNLNADYTVMTGSGSTVLGFFNKRVEAEKAVEYLENRVDFVIMSELYTDKLLDN